PLQRRVLCEPHLGRGRGSPAAWRSGRTRGGWFSMYRYDASYAVEVQRAHPGRFAIIKPLDPDDPAVADVIADWKKTPGTVGIRIILTKEANRAPDDPGLDRIARAAVRHHFPVNGLLWGKCGCGHGAHRWP